MLFLTSSDALDDTPAINVYSPITISMTDRMIAREMLMGTSALSILNWRSSLKKQKMMKTGSGASTMRDKIKLSGLVTMISVLAGSMFLSILKIRSYNVFPKMIW